MENKKELFEEQSTIEKMRDILITIIIWVIMFLIFTYFIPEWENWKLYIGAMIGYSLSIMDKKCKRK